MFLLNYDIVEEIAKTQQAVVFKGYHKNDPGRCLVIKVFRTSHLSGYIKSQFQHKIEHLRVIDDPCIIIPSSLEEQGSNCFVTYDHYDGIPLDQFAASQSKISLDLFFAVGCKLVQALDKVHESGIIHGGIKPHNILVHPQTLNYALIDFISTVDVRNVSHFIFDPSFIRGTLCYTSPEQTGRISHRVSFNSDLYSLGVVFYEILTGRVPFLSDDPLELIHSHLAEEPCPLDRLNSDIPPVLCSIIAKLLRKEPEKRYQSCKGLLADLIRCRDEYSATGTIKEFPLENIVYVPRITFISKMVGREKESNTILQEFEHAAKGTFRAIMISGFSGIGKTRLIQELQKPILKYRGYFTSGKFDVYEKNNPYSSLIQAFRNLLRTILTESDASVAVWKERVLKAVGKNGRVLTDVLPELEILIGQQPEVAELPPVESLNRFRDIFSRFLSSWPQKKIPLPCLQMIFNGATLPPLTF